MSRLTMLFAFITALLLIIGLFPTDYSKKAQANNQQDQRGVGVQVKPSQEANQRRIALVIGNGAYQSSGVLKNPANDARAISQSLKGLGFDVVSLVDIDQRTMKKAISELGAKLQKGGVGLFYYAGHGCQVGGENYLLPIDMPSVSELSSEADIDIYAVKLNAVLNQMGNAGNQLNIVVLDACRNNPFVSRSWRNAQEGLAPIDAALGTFVAFATAPGKVASDGTGNNGLYTEELLKAIKESNLPIETVFKRVLNGVSTKSQGKQIPWTSSALSGEFYFNPNVTSNDASGATSTPTKPQPEPEIERVVPKGTLLIVVGNKDAEININGKSAGKTQAVGEEIRIKNYNTGSVTVVGKLSGKPDIVKQVEIKAGQETRIELVWATTPTSIPATQTNTSTNPITTNPATTNSTTNSSTNPIVKPQGQELINGIGMKLVLIPSGNFDMGSENGENAEKPVHQVVISEPFYMGVYEVTQKQYEAIMGANPSGFKETENLPVERVSWEEAVEFCKKLSEKEAREYRLPTEAEWEYAARAGTRGDYAGNGKIEFLGWYYSNSNSKTHLVGEKQPNAWGLYDMHGNVWEWCQDPWHEDYKGAPSDGKVWEIGADNSKRVVRGGSWVNYSKSCRSSFRFCFEPGSLDDDYGFIGFRVVASARTFQ